MLKRIFILGVVLFCVNGLFAQETVEAVSVLESHYQTLSLDSTEVDTVFFIFPNPRGYYPENVNPIDTLMPSSETVSQFKYKVYRKFATTGAFRISILPDSLNSDSQSDSLYSYIKFLDYNADKDTLTIVDKDSVFLDLDSPDNYTASSMQYLDWDQFTSYHSDLSGELAPAPGIALFLGQDMFQAADDKHTFYIGIWSIR